MPWSENNTARLKNDNWRNTCGLWEPAVCLCDIGTYMIGWNNNEVCLHTYYLLQPQSIWRSVLLTFQQADLIIKILKDLTGGQRLSACYRVISAITQRICVTAIVAGPPGGLIFIWSTVFTLHCYNTNYVTTIIYNLTLGLACQQILRLVRPRHHHLL